MAKYIVLCKYTQKGIENIKESPARLDAAKQAFQAFGGEMKEFYLSMGRYDMVVICEMPDDEAVAKVALTIGSKRAVATETMRIFPEGEYKKIIDALP